MTELIPDSWPLSRLHEALTALIHYSRFAATAGEISPPPTAATRPDVNLNRWIETAVRRQGLEMEPVSSAYGELLQLVRYAGPALLHLPGNEPRFLVLLARQRRDGNQARLLLPNGVIKQVSVESVRTALCHKLEATVTDEIDAVLAVANISSGRRPRTREALIAQRLHMQQIEAGWLLRLSPGVPVWQQARHNGLPWYLAAFVSTYTLQYVLFIASWWLIGRGALQGRLDTGLLTAWGLTLLTFIVVRLLVIRTQGTLAIRTATLLKQRLLYGALRLTPDEIRHQGIGQLLGRVIESEAVESLALNGGFFALTAVIELVIATFILSVDSGGQLRVLLLMAWLFITAVLAWQYAYRRRRWTDARVTMTHDLVERMVGYRTRLAQEAPEHRHEEEDQNLADYLSLSRLMDTMTPLLSTLVPRGWLVLGVIGLAVTFVSGNDTAVLAIELGGTLLALQALKKLSTGITDLTGAAIAWRQVSQLFHAAARPEFVGSPSLSLAANKASDGDGQAVLEGHNLHLRYRDRNEPVLQQCQFRIAANDRILLEGPSGSGKSTLASLLIGLRQPNSGLLLLHGLDQLSLGMAAWRQHIVVVPQFDENHVLTETFAFNLLMGRRWPPRQEDIQEAIAICEELGLGPLITQMPAGLLQMVGETGWQLSHGERSRLYVARALLQDADLIVLDESFAALDPENLQRALSCVLVRAPALLVIAHP